MRKLVLGLLLLTLAACGAAAPATDDTTGAASPAASTEAVASTAPAASASPASNDSTLPLPNVSPGEAAGVAEEVGRQASAFLAQQLNVPADTLTLQSSEEMQWSDGSLGCPRPDTMYTQAIVPGYKLTFSDGSATYALHTNADGSNVVWCDNGQPRELPQP